VKTLLALLAFVFFSSASTASEAHTIELGPLKIEHPWMRFHVIGEDVAEGYLKITNVSPIDVKLMSAASYESLYTTLSRRTVNGTAISTETLDGITIPANSTVEFSPTSYAISFKDLTRKFDPGEVVDVVLTFENLGPLPLDFEVME
jgi:copper(I)-binding protein